MVGVVEITSGKEVVTIHWSGLGSLGPERFGARMCAFQQ